MNITESSKPTKLVDDHYMGSSPIPTGISMFDEALGGGAQPGHLYGILGFTGSGRTTLGCMLTAEGASHEWHNSLTGDTGRKLCFVTTKQSVGDINGMLLSYLAQVPFLDVPNVFAEISKMPVDKLRTLEEHVSRNVASNSVERMVLASLVMRTSVLVVDRGDVEESIWSITAPIEQAIDNRTQTEAGIASIVVDGLDLLVEDYRCLGSQPPESTPRLYQTLLRELRRLAQRKQIPVWVMHHLKHAKAKCKPDFVLTHRDAAECKQFGKLVDGIFVLGTRNFEGRFLLRCTKTTGSAQPDPTVVRFKDGISNIVEVPDASPASLSERSSRDQMPTINIDQETWDQMQALASKQEAEDMERRNRLSVVRAER